MGYSFFIFRFCGGVDFPYACLRDEIAVYPHKRLELSVFWNVSAESCCALLKRIMRDFGFRVVPYVSPVLGFDLRTFAVRCVSVRGTPGFENFD